MSCSLMNDQMIRVISSPSSSTIGFSTLIFAIVQRRYPAGGDAIRKIAVMAVTEPRPASATHEVFNQSGALEPYNVFAADRVLTEALRREGGEWAEAEALELGEICGRPDVVALGV